MLDKEAQNEMLTMGPLEPQVREYITWDEYPHVYSLETAEHINDITRFLVSGIPPLKPHYAYQNLKLVCLASLGLLKKPSQNKDAPLFLRRRWVNLYVMMVKILDDFLQDVIFDPEIRLIRLSPRRILVGSVLHLEIEVEGIWEDRDPANPEAQLQATSVITVTLPRFLRGISLSEAVLAPPATGPIDLNQWIDYEFPDVTGGTRDYVLGGDLEEALKHESFHSVYEAPSRGGVFYQFFQSLHSLFRPFW